MAYEACVVVSGAPIQLLCSQLEQALSDHLMYGAVHSTGLRSSSMVDAWPWALATAAPQETPVNQYTVTAKSPLRSDKDDKVGTE